MIIPVSVAPGIIRTLNYTHRSADLLIGRVGLLLEVRRDDLAGSPDWTANVGSLASDNCRVSVHEVLRGGLGEAEASTVFVAALWRSDGERSQRGDGKSELHFRICK